MANRRVFLSALFQVILITGLFPCAWANTYLVSNTADAGSTTFTANTVRWAVASANGHTGLDYITFSLSGNSITVMEPLLITDSVYVQGNRTEVIGAVNASTNIFVISGGGFNSTISGLALVNASTGVLISSVFGCAVVGCAIGTDWNDAAGKGNVIGISLSSSIGAIIGQPGTPIFRNIISGNGTGVFSANSRLTLVQNNYVGLKSDGVAALPNTNYGIRLSSNTWTSQIGGNMSAGEGNVVSGNGSFGIYLEGADAGGNTLCGNIVGLSAGQSAGVPNSYGVLVKDSSGNAVGLPQAGFGNVVSGNNWAGIEIQGVSATPRLNIIQNNLVGTNPSGATGLGNGTQGMYINGDANLVGGRLAAGFYERNWVGSNGNAGILINGNGNTVSGNSVGLSVDGTAALANATGGIAVTGNGDLIGGTNPDDASNRGNLIAGNSGPGITLNATGTGNTLCGNLVGLNEAGTAALGNSGGIFVNSGASNFFIGGPDATYRNVVSGNAGAGIYLGVGAGCSNGVVQANWIGCDKSGIHALLNTSDALFCNQAGNCLIGG